MGAAGLRWGHVLVLLLVVPMAFSSTLPVFAHVLGGPTAHTCCCGMRAGLCPVCNPDAHDRRFKEMPHCGKCGRDEAVFGSALGSAILPASAVALVSPGLVAKAPPPMIHRLALVFLMPPTPPPRFALS